MVFLHEFIQFDQKLAPRTFVNCEFNAKLLDISTIISSSQLTLARELALKLHLESCILYLDASLSVCIPVENSTAPNTI